MDQVLSQLMNTVINPENDTNYDGLYKNWGKLGQQEQRRKDLLDVQRTNRNNKLDTCRGILDIVNAVERQSSANKSEDNGFRPSIYVAGFTKRSGSYRKVLMMSEWLVERPEDFEENWYVVPCPKGVRMLVVACQGTTKFYNKYGSFRMACSTALPGGNPKGTNYKSHCVVLDCFHVENNNTLYVLDILAWNSQPMTDGETEFRHFWLKAHIEANSELKIISENNEIYFEVLPKYECNRESLNSFMMTFPPFEDHDPPIDGLLFYHKRAHYVSGTTPLVGWLYPWMVHEVLGADITVHTAYLLGKPDDYTNLANYIQTFESNLREKYASVKMAEDYDPKDAEEFTAAQTEERMKRQALEKQKRLERREKREKEEKQDKHEKRDKHEKHGERKHSKKNRRSTEQADDSMDAEEFPVSLFQTPQANVTKPRLIRIRPNADPPRNPPGQDDKPAFLSVGASKS